MRAVLSRFASWLRGDCPVGVPPTDLFPLLSLLTTRLSPAEAEPPGRDAR